MDLQFLNDALSAFTQAFDAAANTLLGVGLVILGVIATIAWYTTYRYTVFSSGAGLSEAMAGAILSMITFGVTMRIITNLPAMTDALFRTFAYWGSGGALSPDEREEIDDCIRVGTLLSILQSRARRVLKAAGQDP